MLHSIQDIIKTIKSAQRCVDIKQALEEIASNNGIMIDVREPSETLEKPIKQSLNIPRGVLEMKLPELHPNADTAIYLHCATSARATLAAEQLQRLGYSNVSVISCAIDTIAQHCKTN